MWSLKGTIIQENLFYKNDWVEFNYTLPDENAKGIIKIIDVNGIMVTSFHVNGKYGQKVWDTRDIKPGVYFYTLNVAEILRSGKVIIN